MEEVLKKAILQLDIDDVVQLSLADLMYLVPETEMNYEVDEASMRAISDILKRSGLDSEPRIRNGIIKRALDSKIFLYKSDRSVLVDSSSYRNALAMVRMAVLMAKVDGKSTNEELETIRSLISNMSYLTAFQQRSLVARAMYLLDPAQKYDVRARDFVRAALNRQKIVELVENASDAAASLMIDMAKSIAIADGFIERSELKLLQDMYRARGLSARSTKTDLEKYAREEYVDLKTREEPAQVQADELEEVGDILGDLLLDFDDY